MSQSNPEHLRPGHLAPRPGMYPVVNPTGRPVGNPIHSDQGKPLPPTKKPGLEYIPPASKRK